MTEFPGQRRKCSLFVWSDGMEIGRKANPMGSTESGLNTLITFPLACLLDVEVSWKRWEQMKSSLTLSQQVASGAAVSGFLLHPDVPADFSQFHFLYITLISL